MLKFHGDKYRQTSGTAAFLGHSTSQETPVTLYIGLMLHAHTCKREPVEKVAHLDLSNAMNMFFRSQLRWGTASASSFKESKWYTLHNCTVKYCWQYQSEWFRVCSQRMSYGTMSYGNDKCFCYLAGHEIAAGLAPEKAHALPVFHALTGCDTVSRFVGHLKKSAWTVWGILHMPHVSFREAHAHVVSASQMTLQDMATIRGLLSCSMTEQAHRQM